jgi:hypothetical protein
VTVQYYKLKEVIVWAAFWKEVPNVSVTIEVRRDNPKGKLITSKHFEGDIKGKGGFSLPITEDLAIGSTLYIAMIPDGDFPEQEVGWWSKPDDVYAGGTAFLNGQPISGDRLVKLSYLVRPDVMRGEWIWQPETVSVPHTCYFRKTFELKTGQDVVKAEVKVTADNGYKLYINGVFIGEDDNWSSVET